MSDFGKDLVMMLKTMKTKEAEKTYPPGEYIDHQGDPAIKHPDGSWMLFFSDLKDSVKWREVPAESASIIEGYANQKGGWKSKEKTHD